MSLYKYTNEGKDLFNGLLFINASERGINISGEIITYQEQQSNTLKTIYK
jgi:hypothetical protein